MIINNFRSLLRAIHGYGRLGELNVFHMVATCVLQQQQPSSYLGVRTCVAVRAHSLACCCCCAAVHTKKLASVQCVVNDNFVVTVKT